MESQQGCVFKLCVCVCEDLITLSVQFDEHQAKRYQPECLCVCVSVLK